MKTKSVSTMGALHPILFFAFVYMVALVFSIFICSSIFYSLNGKSVSLDSEIAVPTKPLPAVTQFSSVAMR